jgi:hypothetical protein
LNKNIIRKRLEGALEMHIYLDDSGNIDSAEGKLYVWAGFSVKSGYKKLEKELDEILSPFSSGDNEIKGKNASFNQQFDLFQCLIQWNTLRICYIIVDKGVVTENQKSFVRNATSRSKEQSENYFLSKVISRLAIPYEEGTEKRVLCNIDGSPMRQDESVTRLHEYLSLRINFPKWNNEYNWNNFIIKYNSKKNDRLMQAADFLASFFLEYYKLMHYSNKKNFVEVNKKVQLYGILQPKIIHKIYGLPNLSLI